LIVTLAAGSFGRPRLSFMLAAVFPPDAMRHKLVILSSKS
jgi:hypothetical protein